MKKYALLLLVSLMVTSCQQELLNTPEEETPTQKLKGIRFDLNDHVDIDCGVVYGAVKYRGEWLGARIVKYHKDSK